MQTQMDAVERDLSMTVFFDTPKTSFFQLVLPYSSPITYAMTLNFHWKVYDATSNSWFGMFFMRRKMFLQKYLEF